MDTSMRDVLENCHRTGLQRIDAKKPAVNFAFVSKSREAQIANNAA